MDPREQPWTWTSPDLLVVKDGDGGRIRLRVRNRGNAAAGRVAARVEWQDGSAGLDTSRWQHVGTGELTGLEPDQEGWLEIPWSPPHGEQAYALRATITADDDPTTDDKTVISTFGRIALPGFADAVLS